MCVELYRWSIELEGVFVLPLAPRWVRPIYLSEKGTNDPLYLWVINAYIHDHCLGYRHDYLLFCQLPNSNLFTHRMLFSREAFSENHGPGVYFYHILKILKIPCCNFYFFILFCIFVRSIYLSPYNLILQVTAQGLRTPCSCWVQGFAILCRYF